MNNYAEQKKTEISKIEDIIKQYCPKEEGLQKIIFEAMNYSVEAGGKRLRPMLILESCRLFGGNDEEAYPFMAAMEMIHTYSLVHDDLPAMDNDEYRRGKKTTHIAFGEDMAILAGDALLNYAFEIMSEAVVNSKQPEKMAKAMNTIAKKAGVYGMIGGQTVDVLNEDRPMNIYTINFIYKLKTSALIEASMMTGAILGNATDDDIKKMEQIARNVGLAFQIQDDILDVTSTTEELGKPVLSDEKNHKTTYVTLMGIDDAKKKVEDYSNDALNLLDELNYKNEFLNNLINELINRKK